jgi:hypothetical protein
MYDEEAFGAAGRSVDRLPLGTKTVVLEVCRTGSR